MVPDPMNGEIDMSFECQFRNVAFGAVEDISGLLSLVEEEHEKLGFSVSSTRAQWNGCHYAVISHSTPERWAFPLWDEAIPKFPKLRFLLSKNSERRHYLTEVVQQRHQPYGFCLCLRDYTTPQTLGEFPSDRNPISVLEDFHDEVLRDQDLRHALNLLGYPVEMLVGCSVSAIA